MLADAVREAARRFGGAAALVEVEGPSISFRGLDEESDAAAAALRARGVREGDCVALRLPSGCAYLVAYAAAAKLGAGLVGINTGLAEREQNALLDVADPRLVLDSVEVVGDLVNQGWTLAKPPELPADDQRLAALVFTSGTTGRPKAAVFHERQLRAVTVLDTGGVWADSAGTPALSSTHFAHVGFMTKLPWYLQRGLTTHVLRSWRAGPVLELASGLRIAQLGAIAAQVALMLRDPGFDSYDLTDLRSLVVGGAASSPMLVDEARRRFDADYLVRYSSTESGGCGLGTVPADGPDAALRGVGRPRPGVRAAVRDTAGNLHNVGEGELVLASPTVMSGYWRDEAGTAEVLHGDWLRTGDLAEIDTDGVVRIVGRAKEMYIRGGYNVAMGEVEAALSLHPLVAACAVQPRPDPVMGEIGVAVVVPRSHNALPDLQGIRAFLEPSLGRWKLPEALVLVEELPLTSMHKIDRRVLADLVSDSPPDEVSLHPR